MKADEFAQLLRGVDELVRYSQGKAVPGLRVHKAEPPDVKLVRETVKVTQAEFAHIIGVNLRTLQNWEQRRNNPDRTASAYLWAIAELPRQISEAQVVDSRAVDAVGCFIGSQNTELRGPRD